MDPIISEPGEGLEYPMESDSLVRFKVLARNTNHIFEMYERKVPPHTIGADPHYHKTTVETFYVIEGTVNILNGETRKDFSAGSIVVVPEMSVHGFWNNSKKPVKVLVTFCPGIDHDEFFKELSRLKRGPVETYADDLAALRKRFDSESVQE
jgi:quercetin dioxygenase-like cupin family protein